jgi:hypothetical protein
MTDNQKIICGVYTCEKYRNRVQAVQDTWLKPFREKYYTVFVESDEGKDARVEGNTLYLNCPEGYEYLAVKTYHFVKYCLKHFEFDYVFKVDDDTYINITAFEKFSKTGDYIGCFVPVIGSNIDRTWHFGKFLNSSLEKPYAGPFIAKWAAGGDGYFLSRKAAKIFVDKATEVVNSELVEPASCGWEDKMVGDILASEADLIRQNSPLGSFGTIHPVSPRVMHAIHAQLKDVQ